MNTVTAALCKKPILGIAMWLATLCATNQLLKDTFVDLQSPDIILFKEIEVPMDDEYRMLILLRPLESSAQQQGHASWSDVICPISQEKNVEIAAYTLRPSRISLTIEVLSEKGVAMLERKFSPTCPRPKNESVESLFLGSIELKRGKYKLRVTNKSPLLGGVAHHTQVLLMGQGTGFP